MINERLLPDFVEQVNNSVPEIPKIPEISFEVIHGPVVMPELKNDTIKAELGRGTWKLLHTMMARFPENPTTSEKEALRNFLHLFSRLYPCGECAAEFQEILKKYPPQVSSREAASQWACAIHNMVNVRLKKEIFDCGSIADKYKCGCDDENDNKKDKIEDSATDSTTESNGDDFYFDSYE
ncbi:ERV/ALR sulfhydryl oxidase domain-containing protein [Gigaspora rosea]|uniref:Sulfhydryl oxidase n=1 Tax=Gigaspora rosea TaxID=44941 RepID=A0A397W340_9GLOM|nr:ERV/ALR sulfhydryl oxidase domain-containing protein [Gigaspora rosea]